MVTETHAAAQVIFGLSPVIVSLCIFAGVYGLLIADRLNHAVVSLTGAALMVLLGVINQSQAYAGLDLNTLFVLIGMMILVGLTKRSGLFQFVSIYSAKIVSGNPRALLAVMGVITAVFSGLLDNVTTVLLIVPVVLLLTEQLKLNPYPFLFTQIFYSNVGGTATLIGDPPNIMIGSALGLSFTDFLVNLAPVVVILMVILLIFFDFIWGRHMTASMRDRCQLVKYNAFAALKDKRMLRNSLFVMGLVIFGFTWGHGHGMETGTVAMAGAALLMFLDCWPEKSTEQTKRVHAVFNDVEWETIFFFIGLFMVVAGLEHAGILVWFADKIMEVTQGDMTQTGFLIIWISAIVSGVVDNIPFVATMIPVLEEMGNNMGGQDAIMPLWWMLALGACLGGNGTIIAASANVVVAGFARKAGHPIPFLKFMLLAFPIMLMTIVVATIYSWFMFLT